MYGDRLSVKKYRESSFLQNITMNKYFFSSKMEVCRPLLLLMYLSELDLLITCVINISSSELLLTE